MKPKIIPITDLRNTNEILRLAKEESPVFVTKNGYNEIVLMSSDAYDALTAKNPVILKQDFSKKHRNYRPADASETYGFLTVGACSFDGVVGNVHQNVHLICDQIDRALAQKVSVLVFPELCLCGYTCGDLLIQNGLRKQIQEGLLELRKFSEGKNLLFFVGAPVSFQDSLYNCAVVFYNGEILAVVPKKYIPNYKEFYEARYFVSYTGENSFVSIGKQYVPFGNRILFQNDAHEAEILACEICEDLWVRNSPSLDHTAAGATVVFNLSASNETAGKDEVRKQMVRETSRRTKCAYVYCSSSCTESTTDLLFSGQNIISELGDELVSSPLFYSNMTTATVDLERIQTMRKYEKSSPLPSGNYQIVHYQAPRALPSELICRKLSDLPFVRSDFSLGEADFEKILTMQALSLGRRLTSIHCKTVVLGISGGLDSAMALLVCHRAYELLSLDAKGIICITLPCFGTSHRTHQNALKIAETLGNTFLEIDISKAVEQHLKDIRHDKDAYDITYENAQARERTKVLMDYANKTGGIVIGTGDLSEIALGWSTYNGDHMSMYNVNCSLPKTLIRAMVKHLAATRYQKIQNVLEDILDTPISPELLPSGETIQQKTEDIIGPYELHDFFLYHYMNNYYSFPKIYYLAKLVFQNQFSPQEIKRWLMVFIRRFFRNQFKRSCMPDGCKITSVSLSPRGDLRLPSDLSCQSFLDEIERMD